MVRRLFFDTNVVLDIIDSDRPSHRNSLNLWIKAVEDGVEIVISEDMLSTIYYVNDDKAYTLEFFQMIQKRWQIVPFGIKVISEALSLALEKRTLDLEDILQCLCAREYGCDIFVTNDKKFCNCGIKIASVEELLS